MFTFAAVCYVNFQCSRITWTFKFGYGLSFRINNAVTALLIRKVDFYDSTDTKTRI